ncbi:HEAT repeat domain-containing protein, partial [Thermodesulfobacteriota bacterium]
IQGRKIKDEKERKKLRIGLKEKIEIEFEDFKRRSEKDSQKQDVLIFLEDIEDRFKHMEPFRSPEKIVWKDQYIPIQVTLERKYRHDVETFYGYPESDDELKNAYAFKGIDTETIHGQVPWEKARKDYDRIIVLADPGMGKTSLLRREAKMTAHQVGQSLSKNENIDCVIFPIYIRLPDLENWEDEIFDAILQIVNRDYPKTSNSKAIKHLLERKLYNGQCLLLLDALDEIPVERRNNLVEKLNHFANNYKCQIIYTSRIVGYSSGILENIKEVEIVPFNQTQIKNYADKWFENAASTIQDNTVSPDVFLKDLRDKPQIWGITQIPLLLSLLCRLYLDNNLTLPARKVDVYEKAIDHMLGEWSNKRKPKTEWMIVPKTELLEELAYDFTREGKQIFSANELYDWFDTYLKRDDIPKDFRNSNPIELLDELSEDDGLLLGLDKQNKRYIFLHRTFQEFLTASYLKKLIQKNQSNGLELVRKRLWLHYWHETITLLSGLMEDPIPLIQAIAGEDEKDDIFFTRLILAGRCVAECDDNYQRYFQNILESIFNLWMGDYSLTYRTIVNSIARSSSQMLGIFIGSLTHPKFDVRKRAVEALGDIGSEQSVEHLSNSLKDGDRILKIESAWALSKIGSDKAIKPLIRALKDHNDDVRIFSAVALGIIGSDRAVGSLIEALKDRYWVVRQKAALALRKIDNSQAAGPLIQALKDKSIRLYDVKILGMLGNKDAIEPLTLALKDKNEELRSMAALALGELGSDKAIEPLIEALKDKVDAVRSSVIKALSYIDSDKAFKPLIEALKDKDSNIRESAVYGLRLHDPKKTVKHLIQMLKDENTNVKSSAADILGLIGNKNAVKPLIQTLRDGNQYVRIEAARSLGRIGSDKAIEPLIEALKDRVSRVRDAAIKALGNIDSDKAIEPLIEALKDRVSDVRRKTAQILGAIGPVNILEMLVKNTDIDIYEPEIFSLARSLAIRYCKAETDFIPVYPELIESYKSTPNIR